MLTAAPVPAACADLDTCLAHEMWGAVTIADLGHHATAGATGWQVMRAAERVHINRQGQRSALGSRAISADVEGIAMERAKDGNRFQQAGADDEAIALAGHIQFALFFSLLRLLFLLLALLFGFQLGGFFFAQ